MADPVRDFLLSDDDGLAVVNGDFATVSGQDAVAQAITIRLRMFLGEVWLDESIGVPWIQEILGKNRDPVRVRQILSDEIAKIPDVLEVVGTDLVLDPQTRAFTVSYSVRTIYSTTPLSGQVEG